MKAIVCGMMLLVGIGVAEGQMQWTYYSVPTQIYSFYEDGNYVWEGTNYGLFKMDKSGNMVAHYTKDNSGLNNNTIYSLAKDTTGKLWVGTGGGGLNVFDGSNWKYYNSTNSALTCGIIWSIAIDGKGIVWLGTYKAGLVRFDGSSFTLYKITNSGIPLNYVKVVQIDGSGNKWVGTFGGGLAKFNGTTWSVYNDTNSGLPNNYITSLAIDVNGDKWIGAYVAGVTKFDGTHWKIYYDSNSTPNSLRYTTSVTIDKYRNKWIGTNCGIQYLLGLNWIDYIPTNSGLPSYTVNCIMTDNTGNEWIGTDKGAVKFDGSKWTNLTFANAALPDNIINTIVVDGNGNRWIGTRDAGLSKYDGMNWTNYNTSNSGLPYNRIISLATDNKGIVWIGTASSGVARFDGNNWTVYNSKNSSIPYNYITSLTVDGNGKAWIGTGTGLSTFDGSNWNMYNSFNSKLPNDGINALLADSSGNVWVGTNGGLAKFDGSNWTVYKKANSGLPNDTVLSLGIDKAGNKWVGTYRGGVARFDKSNWKVYNTTNSGLLSNTVTSIAFDGEGNKWIGTDNGLGRFNDSLWNVYNTTNSQIAYNYINAVVVDLQDEVFIGTNNGMSKMYCESPVVNFVADTVCLPGNGTYFINASTMTDNFTVYKWDIGDDGSVEYTNSFPIRLFSSPGIYKVKLVEANMRCRDSVVKNVVVGIVPKVSIYGANSYCPDSAVKLTAIDSNYHSGLNYSFKWSTGDTTKSIMSDSSRNYRVMVTDYVCTDTSGVKTIIEKQPYGQEIICLVTVDTASGKNQIIWEKTAGYGTASYNIYKQTSPNYFANIGNVDFNSGGVFTDLSSDPGNQSDRYKISVVDTCNDESLLSPTHKTVKVSITENGNIVSLSWEQYYDESLKFVPNIYYIYRGTQLGNIQVYDSVTITKTNYNDSNVSGKYFYLVGVRKKNGCETGSGGNIGWSFSNIVSNIPTGIKETMPTYKFVIYPNPFRESTTVKVDEGLAAGGYSYRVMDCSGKVLLSKTKQNSVEINISGGELGKGMYFLEIEGVSTLRTKLIVE